MPGLLSGNRWAMLSAAIMRTEPVAFKFTFPFWVVIVSPRMVVVVNMCGDGEDVQHAE
jgi:hypothetical protein